MIRYELKTCEDSNDFSSLIFQNSLKLPRLILTLPLWCSDWIPVTLTGHLVAAWNPSEFVHHKFLLTNYWTLPNFLLGISLSQKLSKKFALISLKPNWIKWSSHPQEAEENKSHTFQPNKRWNNIFHTIEMERKRKFRWFKKNLQLIMIFLWDENFLVTT